MSNDFKKFIDTGGKSLDEIKKQIGKLLSKSANSLVNDIEKQIGNEISKAVKNTVTETLNRTIKAEKIPSGKERSDFAEKSGTSREFTVEADEIAYPHENIQEELSQHDILINEKILEMRKQKQTTYNGYIIQRCSEITFVLQGEYVADIEDDYSRCVFFGMVSPMYAAMSNSQLRTYFTWRTDIRRGVFRDIDRSYIILYVYELLNKIGVSSSDEAFSKLLTLRKSAKAHNAAAYLSEVLPQWLKDFYVYNRVSGDFPDLDDFLGNNEKNDGKRSAIEISRGIYKNKLDFLADNSAYKIKESSFYSEKTARLIDAALENVLKELSVYCEKMGIALDMLICGQMKKDHSWRAFAGAIVNLDRMDGFRSVRISPEEEYCIKRGEPVREEYSLLLQRGVIGFILKTIEARLRIRTGFARRLTVNRKMLVNDVKNREKAAAAVLNDEFEKIIVNAVDKFCDEHGIVAREHNSRASGDDENFVYQAKKVEIDVSKLSKIREKSEEIAKKLIVQEITDGDEEADAEESTDKNSAAVNAAENSENNILFPDIEDIESKAEQISDDDFSEKISAYSALSDEKGGWGELANVLSEQERELLAVMYENKDAAEYCRKNGLMPETVFEKINDLALETVGDIVIENGVIIEDYLKEIADCICKDL